MTNHRTASQFSLTDFLTETRLKRAEHVLSLRTKSLTVLLDRIHNFHNISAIIRSADAFGLCELHLVGDSFDFSPDISLGAEQWVELRRHESPTAAASALISNGFELVVLEPESKLTNSAGRIILPVNELPFERKLALVLGNEHEGVSADILERAHFSSYIPMFGFVDSLNVSVACAISLFCATLPDSTGQRKTKPLKPDETEVLKTSWLRRLVRNSSAILREVEARKKFVPQNNHKEPT